MHFGMQADELRSLMQAGSCRAEEHHVQKQPKPSSCCVRHNAASAILAHQAPRPSSCSLPSGQRCIAELLQIQ